MSVDLLQEKIRKMKNPSIVDMTASADMIPQCVFEEHAGFLQAYYAFCREILGSLANVVPAVRFRFSNFSLLGPEGLSVLQECLGFASKLGYYVLLDCVDILSPMVARQAAQTLFSDESLWQFDGLIVSTYIGSDGLKPFVKLLADSPKGLYGVVRSGNKSAAELQDLFTGNRLSHTAAADLVNRLGEPLAGRSGYNRIGAMAGAASADGLRVLRSKYSRLFLILDGYDYPNANAKNCSFAFDKFGHGACAIAGTSVTCAWSQAESDGRDFVALAVSACERMKKNLTRYTTIL